MVESRRRSNTLGWYFCTDEKLIAWSIYHEYSEFSLLLSKPPEEMRGFESREQNSEYKQPLSLAGMLAGMLAALTKKYNNFYYHEMAPAS